jgi:hypothetical protein
MSITNLADCDLHLVIRFMIVKKFRPAEMQRQLIKVHGEGAINEGNVRKWCRSFSGIETRSGCPPVSTEDFKDRVDAHVHENGRFAIDELH